MKRMPARFAVIVLAVFMVSCAHVEGPRIEPEKPAPNIIEVLCSDLKQHLASKFYNFDKNRTVEIHINPVKSNFAEEPALSAFVYDQMVECMDKAHQINNVALSDPGLEAIIDVNIINDSHEITFLVTESDPRSNAINYSFAKKCDFSNPAFAAYSEQKADYESRRISRQNHQSAKSRHASLTIKAVSIGDSFKEDDKYYLYTYSRYFYTDSYVIKDDTGYSGDYPTELSCRFMDKEYEPNLDNIIFEGEVPPDTIEFTASFRGAHWDAWERHQDLSEKVQKKFLVKFQENDDIRIDIIYVYKGPKSGILVEVYRVKDVMADVKMTTRENRIAVFY